MKSLLFTQRRAVLITMLGAVIVMAFNLYVANHVTVVLPLSDGWAAWDRVMLFNSGGISWTHFIFTPHGAHLHSIIYFIAWLDYWLSGADQKIMQFASLSAIAIFALGIGATVWKWASIHQQPRWLKFLASISTAALLTSVIDLDMMMLPFQGVLSISRLAYFTLLATITVSLLQQKPRLYAVSMLISLLAVTFHGSGYLFAGLVVLAHLLIARRPLPLVCAFFPLLAVFAVQNKFGVAGGELGQMGKLLTPGVVFAFVQGISAYFAMPFRALQSALGDTGLLVAGFLSASATLVLTLLSLRHFWRLARRQRDVLRGGQHLVRADVGRMPYLAMITLTGVFLLLSAAAATAFWIVRNADAGNAPAYVNILVSPRYTAYSTMTLIMVLGYLLTGRKPALRIVTGVVSTLFLVLGIWPAAHIDRYYPTDDLLNRAAAALSIGISPIRPEAEAVWINAHEDPYWSARLPKVVTQLRIQQKSLWKELPPLGAVIDGPLTSLPLGLARVHQLDGLPGKCGIEGTVLTERTQGSQGAIVALVAENREVIGYAARMRHEFGPVGRRVEGYIVCESNTSLLPATFISEVPAKWHKTPVKSIFLPSAKNISDQNWLNGISRTSVGFIADASEISTQAYKPGAIIRMPDGQIKTVTAVEKSGENLNVLVDGAPIDGNINGFPYPIELIH